MASDAKQKRIIIVDDEPDILIILEEVLRMRGYTSKGFSLPSDALEYFKSNSDACGLVISDVRMPEMNGFELAREMEKINPDVPVILMTAFEIRNSEFEKVFPSSKIRELVTKPILPTKFVQIVEKYLPLTKP